MNWGLATPVVTLGVFSALWGVALDRVVGKRTEEPLKRIGPVMYAAFAPPATGSQSSSPVLRSGPTDASSFAAAKDDFDSMLSWYSDLAQLGAVSVSCGLALLLARLSLPVCIVAGALLLVAVLWLWNLAGVDNPEKHGRRWRDAPGHLSALRRRVSLIAILAIAAHVVVSIVLLAEPDTEASSDPCRSEVAASTTTSTTLAASDRRGDRSEATSDC